MLGQITGSEYATIEKVVTKLGDSSHGERPVVIDGVDSATGLGSVAQPAALDGPPGSVEEL
jgi:hypothetical protein